MTEHVARPENRRWGATFVQVGLVAAGLLAYLGVRAITSSDYDDAVAHARSVLAFERRLGFDWEMGAQKAILGRDSLVRFFDNYYVWTYWPVLIGTLVLLWKIDPIRYRLARNALLISGVFGLISFATYPVAPPRMLDGFTDTVSSAAREHFVSRPSGLINPYAALPSFHAGWFAMLLGVLAMAVGQRWMFVLAVAASSLMIVAVVVTANHYVIDVVAGIALAGLGLAIARRLPPRLTGVDPSGATTPQCDAGAEHPTSAGASPS